MILPNNEVPAVLSTVEKCAAELAGVTTKPALSTDTYGPPVAFVYGNSYAQYSTAALANAAVVEADARPVTNRAYVSPIITMGKRLVKRATAWYVDSLARRATEFNTAILHVVEGMLHRFEQLENRQRRQSERLSAEIAALRSELAEIGARVDPPATKSDSPPNGAGSEVAL
jgi:hypothetical protein